MKFLLYAGSDKVAELYAGNIGIKQLYAGSNLVYERQGGFIFIELETKKKDRFIPAGSTAFVDKLSRNFMCKSE